MPNFNFNFTPPVINLDRAPFAAAGAAVAPALRASRNMPLTTLRCKHLDGSPLTPEERLNAAQVARELNHDGILSDENRTWLALKGINWEE